MRLPQTHCQVEKRKARNVKTTGAEASQRKSGRSPNQVSPPSRASDGRVTCVGSGRGAPVFTLEAGTVAH